MRWKPCGQPPSQAGRPARSRGAPPRMLRLVGVRSHALREPMSKHGSPALITSSRAGRLREGLKRFARLRAPYRLLPRCAGQSKWPKPAAACGTPLPVSRAATWPGFDIDLSSPTARVSAGLPPARRGPFDARCCVRRCGRRAEARLRSNYIWFEGRGLCDERLGSTPQLLAKLARRG